MNSDPEVPSRFVSSYRISLQLVLKHSWSIEGENIYEASIPRFIRFRRRGYVVSYIVCSSHQKITYKVKKTSDYVLCTTII